MATTLVACALRHDQAIVSHVGDSRCYLVRDGQAKQITQDHTWVNEQRKMGLISASEMAESESRHVLIRSLGPEMFVSADTTASQGDHDKVQARIHLARRQKAHS
jgi:PPM family protein phosphatase